jgi:hypothetical protein
MNNNKPKRKSVRQQYEEQGNDVQQENKTTKEVRTQENKSKPSRKRKKQEHVWA